MPKRAVRIPPELDQVMHLTAKDRGYRTPSAFIRAAIEHEVKARNELAGMEEQTAASFDRVAKDLRRIARAQQALFAMVDALTKVVLSCVPEPTGEAKSQAIASGRERYARLIQSAGQSMAKNGQGSLQALINHDEE